MFLGTPSLNSFTEVKLTSKYVDKNTLVLLVWKYFMFVPSTYIHYYIDEQYCNN